MRIIEHTYGVRGQMLSESKDHVEAAQTGASQFETNTAKVKSLIEELRVWSIEAGVLVIVINIILQCHTGKKEPH